MSKLTDIEQMFGEVMIDGTPYRIAGTDIIDRINKYISEIITGNQEMYFSNEVPVFNNLEEWMDRVALIRETLRNEQRKAAGITAKGDNA